MGSHFRSRFRNLFFRVKIWLTTRQATTRDGRERTENRKICMKMKGIDGKRVEGM